MRYTNNKDINQYLDTLTEQGWKPRRNNGHWRFSLDGRDMIVSSSPSDFRALEKIKTLVRKFNRERHEAAQTQVRH